MGLQRLQSQRGDRQWLWQPDQQQPADPLPLQNGHPRDRQKPLPQQYPGAAHLVQHPPQQRWLPRPPRTRRNYDLHERRHRGRRYGKRRARRNYPLRRQPSSRQSPQRCPVLPHAGQNPGQSRRCDLQPAALRRQYGLRRRGRLLARHRNGRDQKCPRLEF